MISTFQKKSKKVNFNPSVKNVSENEYESSEESSASSEEMVEAVEKETSEKDELSDVDYSEDDLDDIEVDDEEEMKRRIERSRENMKHLIQNFSDAQLQRYETFRRAGFQRGAMKKVLHQILGHSINPNSIIVCSGVAKVFVGELVEMAREVLLEWGDEGPLLPSHIREAHRRMKMKGMIPQSSLYRNNFKW